MMVSRGMLGCAVTGSPHTKCGEVQAVFARCAHLRFGNEYITFGDTSIPPHPFSVCGEGFSGEELRLSQQVYVTPAGIFAARQQFACFDTMQVFSPKLRSSRVASSHAIGAALYASLKQVAGYPSRGGFHEILLRCVGRETSTNDDVSRRMSDRAHALALALAGAVRTRNWEAMAQIALEIAGTGIGLTPSGDDFLAGVLSALRFYSSSMPHPCCSNSVLQDIACCAGAKTSPFSAFLMVSASEGLVAEPFSEWLSAVHCGDSDTALEQIPKIANVGHSSGFDTISGMLLALQSLVGERLWTN